MTDEAANRLADALNRFAAALEAVSSPGHGARGIQVNHSGGLQQVVYAGIESSGGVQHRQDVLNGTYGF